MAGCWTDPEPDRVTVRPRSSSVRPTFGDAACCPHASPMSQTPSNWAVPGAAVITLCARSVPYALSAA